MKKPNFHVVAPSLPNFGFRQRIAKRGFCAVAVRRDVLFADEGTQVCAVRESRRRLGGFYVTRIMGVVYPSSVVASHINLVHAQPPVWTSQPGLPLQHAATPYTAAEKGGMERSAWFVTEGQAYWQLQTTKPQTLAYAFADSPVALLAWTYEKLVDWTDGCAWTTDEILTWLSIYCFSTAGPNAHIRIYYEAQHHPTACVPDRDRASQWVYGVKLGVAHFPRELTVVPRLWAKTLGMCAPYDNTVPITPCSLFFLLFSPYMSRL